MREAVAELGGDPARINPLAPAEMVIDHSVIADVFGRADAFEKNVELEYQRNGERYQFLRWGQTAFNDFKVVPPGTGIVHQVNIEHLARVVFERGGVAYPDTCVGTDSHTTMVNGLGVLGWGVGGIEAEAAMLGQPVSMLIPRVVGFKLSGEIPAGATATDVVLTITEMLRKHGVVGQVRRVLRRGCRRRAAGQPRHDRQHEPRVRLDRRDVPDRRRHLRLPAAHRPQRRPGRARRGLRQGAGPVARPGHGAGVLRVPRARPVHGGAQHRRPEAPAGPDRARPTPRPPSARRSATTSTTGTDNDVDEASKESFPASDPPAYNEQTPEQAAQRRAAPVHPAAQLRRPAEPQGRGHHGRRHADRARPRRTWRSPRSPRAPTPPTPR